MGRSEQILKQQLTMETCRLIWQASGIWRVYERYYQSLRLKDSKGKKANWKEEKR